MRLDFVLNKQKVPSENCWFLNDVIIVVSYDIVINESVLLQLLCFVILNLILEITDVKELHYLVSSIIKSRLKHLLLLLKIIHNHLIFVIEDEGIAFEIVYVSNDPSFTVLHRVSRHLQ